MSAQSLADAISNDQSLGNARNRALNALFFVAGAEGNIDATKFINNNKVEDGADPGDAKVFHDAAYTFAQLNGGVPNGASEQSVLDRFRTALDWDLGNHTSNPNVAAEWDSYLFADDPKGQGYHSVGFQLHFEQSGEQSTKALDNGVDRAATQYHYVGQVPIKSGTPRTEIPEGGNETELWLEQTDNPPDDKVTLDGITYTLDKGSDGKPVSRQQTVRDVAGLNQAIAQAFQAAEQNYKPQYDNAGNLQNADPVTRLAQYSAQTQYHPQTTQAVDSNDPDAADKSGVSGISHGTTKSPTVTTGPSLTHDNPSKSDRDAMQALLNLFGVTSGNYQDMLNAAQSGGAPALGQQSVAAQVIEGFVPGGSLVGALVQYLFNKGLLDWKKQQTQKQGRGTFYIDQLESQNQVQLLTATVQSVFDIALAIVGPPEGLVADILRGLKGLASRIGKAGSDFADAALHDVPRPEGDVPEPDPKPTPAGGPASANEPTTFDAATFGRGELVAGGISGDALRLVKTADGAEVLVAKLADGSFRRVEKTAPNVTAYSLVRLVEPGTPAGEGPLLWLDDTPGRTTAYVQTADDTSYGLPGAGRRPPPKPEDLKTGLESKLSLATQTNAAGENVPFDRGCYGYCIKNKPGGDTAGWEADHFPPYSAYRDTPYAGVAAERMPCVNLPRELHQPIGPGGSYSGNLATSTGRSKLAQTYNQTLQNLLQLGRYGDAFLMDLNEKINLVVLNRARIPVAQQDLTFWDGEFQATADYTYQTGLITEAEHAQASQLIFSKTRQWIDPPTQYRGVTDEELQAYLEAKRTRQPVPDPNVAALIEGGGGCLKSK